MSSPLTPRPQMSRPGGRTAEVSRRVYAATMGLLVEGGFAAVTFQSVAEAAGVGRATLYRRWASSSDLVSEAIRSTAAEQIAIADTGSLRGDIRAILLEIAKFLSDPVGVASVIAGLTLERGKTGGEEGNWSARWNQVRPVFDRALARGELNTNTQAEVLFATLAGALYFRRIVMAQGLDEHWIAQVLDVALAEPGQALDDPSPVLSAP